MKQKLLPISAFVLLSVAVFIGILQVTSQQPNRSKNIAGDLTQSKRLKKTEPELLALTEKGNQLLPGGEAAFNSQLEKLKGTPVVVNKWASWCPPCREEFPFFQSQSKQLEGSVAFIGINSGDQISTAKKFLKEFPIPFPSFEDPDEKLADAINAGSNFPVTVFYSSDGKQSFTHQGGYASESQLSDEIERYAK